MNIIFTSINKTLAWQIIRRINVGVQCILLLCMLSTGSTAHAESKNNAELIMKAAQGEVGALEKLRALPEAELIPLLKEQIKHKKTFAVQELLRIGSDNALNAISDMGMENAAYSPIKRSTTQYVPETLDDTISSIETELENFSEKGNSKKLEEYTKTFKTVKNFVFSKNEEFEPSESPELHVIRVNGASEPLGGNDTGTKSNVGVISVQVTYAQRPIVLFLNAYESVIWEIKLAEGVKLNKVYVNGYWEQSVKGLPKSIPVQNKSFKTGTAKTEDLVDFDDEHTAKVDRVLKRYLGLSAAAYMTDPEGAKYIIGSESEKWRQAYALNEARKLLMTITGKPLVSSVSPEIREILDKLDNTDSVNKAAKELANMPGKESRTVLLDWATESLTRVSENYANYGTAFNVLKNIESSDVANFFINILEEKLPLHEDYKSDIQQNALKALTHMAKIGNKDSQKYVLGLAEAAIEDAANNPSKAYQQIHWIVKFPRSANKEVIRVLGLAAKSEVDLIKNEALRLIKKRKK